MNQILSCSARKLIGPEPNGCAGRAGGQPAFETGLAGNADVAAGISGFAAIISLIIAGIIYIPKIIALF